jgi:hypothetical protein
MRESEPVSLFVAHSRAEAGVCGETLRFNRNCEPLPLGTDFGGISGGIRAERQTIRK